MKGKFLFGVDDSHPVDLLAGVQSTTLDYNHLPGRVAYHVLNRTTDNKTDYALVSNSKLSNANLNTCEPNAWGYVNLIDMERSGMDPTINYSQVAINNMPPYKVAYIWQRIG